MSARTPIQVLRDPSLYTMQTAEHLMSSLQSLSREALVHSIQTRHLVLQQMRHYVSRLPSVDLDALPFRVIHVAGTKGKGSTSAMVSAILQAHGVRVGLYTSPHLVHMRERFRVDGVPVDEATFLAHLHETFAELMDSRPEGERAGDGDEELPPPMPSFFRFLTLVALRMFAALKVEVVVLEVGLGGRLDATNIVQDPVVCGVSRIGYDHMNILGNTLGEIAREKGGILKQGVPAFTIADQPEEAMGALQECAAEAGTKLEPVPRLPDDVDVELGLAGAHQRENAALAVSLAHTYLKIDAPVDAMPPATLEGLKRCRWPARCQVVRFAGQTFYIDGAHTPESIAVAASWVRDELAGLDDDARVGLLFNCAHTRNPVPLVRALLTSLPPFHTIISAPFDADRPRLRPPPSFEELAKESGLPADVVARPQTADLRFVGPDAEACAWQQTVLRTFCALDPHDNSTTDLCCASGVTEALAHLREAGVTHVVVTGSLYISGNVLARTVSAT